MLRLQRLFHKNINNQNLDYDNRVFFYQIIIMSFSSVNIGIVVSARGRSSSALKRIILIFKGSGVAMDSSKHCIKNNRYDKNL